MKTLFYLIITLMILSSCSSTKEAGVISKDKKGRWVWGNAKSMQIRYDYKLRMDSIKLAKH